MYRHIFFDLDGTLTDPFMGITRSAQYALSKYGIHAELTDLKRFIGPPLIDSFCEYYGLTEAQAKQAVEYYRELYRDGGAMFDNRVYDGIPGLLSDLKSRSCELILATSKPIIFARQILEHFGLAEYFDYTFGCELDGRRTRKSEVIAYALECHPVDLSSSIMVGDRLHDVEGAHSNSLPCVGVLWGYGDRPELEKARADFIAGDMLELEKILI